MDDQAQDKITTSFVKRKERLRVYKKKTSHRASRIHRLKQEAVQNRNKVASLNKQVDELKETMAQTNADNKLLKRYYCKRIHAYDSW